MFGERKREEKGKGLARKIKRWPVYHGVMNAAHWRTLLLFAGKVHGLTEGSSAPTATSGGLRQASEELITHLESEADDSPHTGLHCHGLECIGFQVGKSIVRETLAPLRSCCKGRLSGGIPA
jgi:hypothetical protein